jgi:hypothetical protein
MKAMNPKTFFDNAVAAVSGVYGGGVIYTLVILREELLKLAVAATTACICGAAGVAGKYLFVWIWRKLKEQFKTKL